MRDGDRRDPFELPTLPEPCCGPSTGCCNAAGDGRDKGGPGDDMVQPPGAEGAPPGAYVQETIATPGGEARVVGTDLVWADHLGGWKVRWGLGRGGYAVAPGLHAVGAPTADSVVLVSANYKLSFDALRKELAGRDAWILVLDTKGINVWCAAGKGTFGTDELVTRVEATALGEVVSRRRLVLPQLGAPGVSAHEVKRRCGFRVVYGPVLARDLPAFLDAGMKATPAQRTVRFPLLERVRLIPVELVMTPRWALYLGVVLLLASGIGVDGYALDRVVADGLPSLGFILLTTALAGALAPALLPWLPGRAFALKGVWIGAPAAAGAASWVAASPGSHWTSVAAWALMLPALASFVAMNFTGASTYTSLSGVMKEMRVAVPLQALATFVGVTLWLVGRFVA
jgi:hypothetical protein